jgi:hypothetical protein
VLGRFGHDVCVFERCPDVGGVWSAARRYVLARTADEYQRLRRQARMWEPETVRLLDRVGLGPGARRLDVGCGPGELRGHPGTAGPAAGGIVGLARPGVGRRAERDGCQSSMRSLASAVRCIGATCSANSVATSSPRLETRTFSKMALT